MFVADVFMELPKGNTPVRVEDSSMGPVVTEVKGLRGGSEWVLNEIQGALSYDHTLVSQPSVGRIRTSPHPCGGS